jgi:UDP-N-acetylmuramate--alanine ligase
MAVHTSAALPKENPELSEAQKRGIPVYSYFQALGLISKERPTIAVAGTNGKTTTTLMLSKMLEMGGLDPLMIAGGNIVGEHGGGFRMGAGPVVVEACEAYGNFLNLHPVHLIITNIEEDHLDYYKDINEIKSAFEKLIGQVKTGGFLVINVDDKEIKNIEYSVLGLQIKKFGIDSTADFQAINIETDAKSQKFQILDTKYQIPVPGRFNIYNALAASAMALSLGVKPEAIQKALAEFKGSWRRFQEIGNYHGATIISDYGHHPAGVKGTIAAAKQKYPGRRIVAVFHPHHKWRTRLLFDRFVEALSDADVIVLNEIWSAPGREPREDNISSLDLVRAIKALGKEEVYFGADLEVTKKIIDDLLQTGDVILMMGAGYIYKLAEKMTQK